MRWINSGDFRNWADDINCRHTLPFLIERLIRATAASIDQLNFPAFEATQYQGWDGELDATLDIELVPSGRSLWEIGTDRGIKGKADREYKKRSLNPQGYDPKEHTFVFVTPRLWRKGREWAQEKARQGLWKNVVVIDCLGLESWVAHAPAVGAWLANHLKKVPESGVISADDFWNNWINPINGIILSPTLLLGGRQSEQEKVLGLCAKGETLSVISSSNDESLAFIVASHINSDDHKVTFLSKALIVSSDEALRTLANTYTELILVVRAGSAEAINIARRKGHTIFLPRSIGDSRSDSEVIVLPRIDRESFVKALVDSGIGQGRAETLSRDSARSIVVLRRLLKLDINSSPEWAKPSNAGVVIPALLVGRWDEDNPADKEIIERIATESYETYIGRLTLWLRVPDSPFEKIGSKWRLVSPLDAWDHLGRAVTLSQFSKFREEIIKVCREIDPALELDIEDRRFASMRGLKKKYSNWLAEGMLQSLQVIAIYGSRLDVGLTSTPELWVDQVVDDILDSGDPKLWQSIAALMPFLAEASPSAFLSALEQRLEPVDQCIHSLFEEQPGWFHSSSRHHNLLWAIEGISWFPEHITRTALVLSQLDKITPGGGSSNRPLQSLSKVFMPWLPQTKASREERLQALRFLAKKERSSCWKLTLSLLPEHSGGWVDQNEKMRWRMLEIDTPPHVEENVSKNYKDVLSVLYEVFDGTEGGLAALIDRSEHLPYKLRNELLDFVSKSIIGVPQETHESWNRLRHILYRHRTYRSTEWAMSENELKPYQDLFGLLMPLELEARITWLFDEDRPKDPSGDYNHDDIFENESDYQDKLLKRRTHELENLLKQKGMPGIVRLDSLLEDHRFLGEAIANLCTTDEMFLEYVLLASQGKLNIETVGVALFIVANKHSDNWFETIVPRLRKFEFKESELVLLLVRLKQGMELWQYLDATEVSLARGYWEIIYPNFLRLTQDERAVCLSNLEKVGRFSTAIRIAHMYRESISSLTIISLLTRAANAQWIQERRLDGYEIEGLIEELDERKDIEVESIIAIEWLYLGYLSSSISDRGPKQIRAEISKDPKMFMKVIMMFYSSGDESWNAQYLEDKSLEQIKSQVRIAYGFLDSLVLDPVIVEQHGGLANWVDQVRKMALEYGRPDVVDSQLGSILGRCAADSEGVWPSKDVCEVLEFGSNTQVMLKGFGTAVFNKYGRSSRGVYDGGNVERGKEVFFSGKASELRNTYPSVARIFEEKAQWYSNHAKSKDNEAVIRGLEH